MEMDIKHIVSDIQRKWNAKKVVRVHYMFVYAVCCMLYGVKQAFSLFFVSVAMKSGVWHRME